MKFATNVEPGEKAPRSPKEARRRQDYRQIRAPNLVVACDTPWPRVQRFKRDWLLWTPVWGGRLRNIVHTIEWYEY